MQPVFGINVFFPWVLSLSTFLSVSSPQAKWFSKVWDDAQATIISKILLRI